MNFERPSLKKKIVLPLSSLILAALFVAAMAAAGYFYWQTKNPEKLSQDQEKKELTETIGEFIELPTNETPTLATVTDREKLADQTFFLKAENGDKVLIYSESGKAILYRPSTKKVIDMTTTLVQNPNAETEAAAPPAAENGASEATEVPRADLTVTLLEGGIKKGVIAPLEQRVTGELSNYSVDKKGVTVKRTYKGIQVVDRTGANGERAQELATFLGGQVVSMPAGEAAGTSDIIVIIGD